MLSRALLLAGVLAGTSVVAVDAPLQAFTSAEKIAIPVPAGAHGLRFSGGRALYASWIDAKGAVQVSTWAGAAWSAPASLGKADESATGGREPIVLERRDGSLIARWFEEGRTLRASTNTAGKWTAAATLGAGMGSGAGDFAWIADPAITAAFKVAADGDKDTGALFRESIDDAGKSRSVRVVGVPIDATLSVTRWMSDNLSIVALSRDVPRPNGLGRYRTRYLIVGDDGAESHMRDVSGTLSMTSKDGTRLPPVEDSASGPWVRITADQSVGAAWVASDPANTVCAAFESAKGSHPLVRATSVKPIATVALDFASDGTVLVAWSSDDGIFGIRTNVMTDRSSTAERIAKDAVSPKILWTGSIRGDQFIAWSSGSPLRYTLSHVYAPRKK